jgi:DNA-binding response OmpR family regulator
MRVLVVEDCQPLADLVAEGLSDQGIAVDVAYDGTEAAAKLGVSSYDVVVLDRTLPGVPGDTLCRMIGGSDGRAMVLMLSGAASPEERVDGLALGADDYLVKPFSFEVLLARLRAVSRRGAIAQPPVFRVADLSVDPSAREVTRGGRRIALTRTEYGLLELLTKRAGSVVTRDNLIESVWGFNSEVRSNTLDAFIRLLRDKVDTEGETKLIQTVRGVGYCLRAEQA